MTTDQKKQLLDYLGYTFDVEKRETNYVIAPDEWKYGVSYYNYEADRFEETQLAELIDIAWSHHETKERTVYIEWLLLDCGASAFVGDDELYNELWRKHRFKHLPDVMKVYYEQP